MWYLVWAIGVALASFATIKSGVRFEKNEGK